MIAFDEGRHEPDGPGFAERWTFETWQTDGSFGAIAAVTLVPSTRRAWYWSVVVRAGEPLLTIVDTDLRMPSTSLSIRGEGLWADHICETPRDHWSVANEAFAVALDEPDDALGAQRGMLVPLGLDLEWEAVDAPTDTSHGYRIDAMVSGEILIADAALTILAAGRWRHEWGELAWSDPPSANLPRGLRAPLRVDQEGQPPLLVERVVTPDGWHEWLRVEASP